MNFGSLSRLSLILCIRNLLFILHTPRFIDFPALDFSYEYARWYRATTSHRAALWSRRRIRFTSPAPWNRTRRTPLRTSSDRTSLRWVVLDAFTSIRSVHEAAFRRTSARMCCLSSYKAYSAVRTLPWLHWEPSLRVSHRSVIMTLVRLSGCASAQN